MAERPAVRRDLRRFVWPAIALALAALAYRPILASALQSPTAHRIESWLFRPSQLPAALVLGIAGWLAWRRRERLVSLPPQRGLAATAAFALASAALFAWGVLTRSPDLLLPSLAAGTLAFGSAARGLAGARALALPAAVLVLGVRIPDPLLHEIVWALQLATAAASSWLLDAIGRDFVREGAILRSAEHSFHVIDGCSGLQAIATLVVVAILVRELVGRTGWRSWALVAAAPALGFALNAVRIAYIAASPNPEAYAGLQGDHTPQGVALLAGGTAALYALGRALPARATVASRPASGTGAGAGPLPWRSAASGLAALAVASFALPAFPPREEPFLPRVVAFPETRGPYTSEVLRGDPYFFGTPGADQMLYRRYHIGARAESESDDLLIRFVDLLIVLDNQEMSGGAGPLLSSQRMWPGPEWNLVSRRRTRIWEMDLETDLAVAARAEGEQRAVVYSWRLRDEGLGRESLRALFALESSPLRRDRKRALVRLVAYSPYPDELSLDRAKQRLDLFITTFRPELAAL